MSTQPPVTPGRSRRRSKATQKEVTKDAFATLDSSKDFRGRVVRGGAVTLASQVAQFALTIVSTVVLARLLQPGDFGLVAMVTAVTGFLGLLKDSGLSMATVQRQHVTVELISAAFWINVGLGLLLALVCLGLAPAIAAFYREPRAMGITAVFATVFVVEALAMQHFALLRRGMRLQAVAVIEITSALVAIVSGIAMAVAGMGYWTIVYSRLFAAVASSAGAWIAESWRPRTFRRGTGVTSMLRFGGLLTATSLLNYAFRNVDNILIGRYWGAASLGLYQRAYGLLLLPINQINAPIHSVAVATLSRLQSEPARQRRYFIGGYGIAVSAILPITVAAIVFADDIVVAVLGSQWTQAASIFRLLGPAALIGALLNPLGWLFISTGNTDRQLLAAMVWTPLILLAFVLGLPYGPEGVAIGYSSMSAVLALPLVAYAVRGTPVRLRDIGGALLAPMAAALIAGLAGVGFLQQIDGAFTPLVRAFLGCLLVGVVDAFVLLVIFRQWRPYLALAMELSSSRRRAEES